MTEKKGTSPKNLRKFLESDDPALARMGLSMAKGSGVPEELLPIILRLYMWDEDKLIRAAAKSTFMHIAPVDLQAKVKKNWQAKYRTVPVSKNKFPETMRQFWIAFKSQENFSIIALEPLIKALGDKAGNARSNAAEALGMIGDKRTVELIITAIGNKNWRVRYNRDAVKTMIKFGDSAVEPLIKALEDEVWNVRYIAAEALRKIGDKRAVEPLIKALEDKNTRIGSKTASALGEIRDKRAVLPLIKALEDEDENVRYIAAEALGKIGDKRAVEPLTKALEDEYTRDSAVEALLRFGGGAVEPLINTLKDKDEEVRYKAAKALGKTGDKRAVEPLIKALEDEYYSVRQNAAGALDKIGDKRAVIPLIKTLEDENEHVRYIAAEALGKIGDKRAVELLTKALEDEDYRVRSKAADALKKLGTSMSHFDMSTRMNDRE